MGGFFGVAAKDDCVFDLFFGTDYHSHLGTRRAGMAVYGEQGFEKSIHKIENAPFRTKFEKEANSMKGHYGIGCISDYEAQPILVRSHHPPDIMPSEDDPGTDGTGTFPLRKEDIHS